MRKRGGGERESEKIILTGCKNANLMMSEGKKNDEKKLNWPKF